MTTLTLDGPRVAEIGSQRPAGPTPAVAVSMEALVKGAWGRLTAHGVASCPVCQGPMLPTLAAGSAGVSGHCADCGAELA
jgi:hypothetical protein